MHLTRKFNKLPSIGLFFLKNQLITFQKTNILQKFTNYTPPSRFYFCNKRPPINPDEIPKEHLEIQHEPATIGEEELDTYKTKGAISILDHIKGTKDP